MSTVNFADVLKKKRYCHWILNQTDGCRLETLYLLSSIFASTGESFGIIRTLEPFGSDYLETLRLKAVLYPWWEQVKPRSFKLWACQTKVILLLCSFANQFSSACALHRRILTFIWGCNVTLFIYSTVPVPDSVLYSSVCWESVCLFKSVTLQCTESQEDPALGFIFMSFLQGFSRSSDYFCPGRCGGIPINPPASNCLTILTVHFSSKPWTVPHLCFGMAALSSPGMFNWCHMEHLVTFVIYFPFVILFWTHCWLWKLRISRKFRRRLLRLKFIHSHYYYYLPT